MKRFWERLKTWLKHQYRFILVDETTHRESLVYAFTVGRVLAVLGVVIGVVLLMNTAAIVFTPIREMIPGYTDPEFKERQGLLISKLDSMEAKIASQDSFILSLQRVSGYTPADTGALRRLKQQTQAAALAEGTPKPMVPVSQRLGATPVRVGAAAGQPLLFWPAEGNLTSRFSARERHYAIDIAAPEQSAVRSVAEGTVVLTEYSDRTGFVIALQHPDGMITLYKHNAQLLKTLGSWVNAGEAIAAVGNSGMHTTGPHLHFEVWVNGQPVDPLLLLPAPKRAPRVP